MCYDCDYSGYETEPEPRTWDDTERYIEATYYKVVRDMAHALAPDQPSPRPSWWTLLTPWPSDIEFVDERDIEDRSPLNSSPLLMDHRIYMVWGDGVYPNRWRVYSYMQKVDFAAETSSIPAVQMVEPPPWGWWMPSLIGV